jgi:hypothetical protein
MKYSKYKEIYFLLFLFLISINLTFINSQNLCPYTELENLLKYYRKGINPSEKEEDNDQYKWEFIHCVNSYHNSTYLSKNSKDPYFKANSGVMIGSSINLGKLNEDFIKTNLTNLKEDDRNKLIKLIGKFGKDAEFIFKNITFDFNESKINYINKQVYEQYYKEMIEFAELGELSLGQQLAQLTPLGADGVGVVLTNLYRNILNLCRSLHNGSQNRDRHQFLYLSFKVWTFHYAN